MNKKGSAVLIVVVILGILLIAGIVFVFIKADQESTRIYDNMAKEVAQSKDDPIYGYGTQVDESIIKDSSKYESKNKPKPIIYVAPTLKKKK